MVAPLVGALGSLGSRVGMRVGVSVLEREAKKKGLAAAARSAAAANPAPAATGRQLASGALTAAGAGSAAVGMGAAMDRGDYAGAVINGAGVLGGGGRLASAALNSGRAGVGLNNFGVAAGAGGASNVALGTASAMMGNTPPVRAAGPTGVPGQGSLVGDPQETATTVDTESTAGGAQQVPTVVNSADRRALERDQLLGQNIAGVANAAGRNYQEITQDLRRMADQGPQQWNTSLRDMTEWEADNRRREIRMAYRNHPIPGKGENRVLDFDRDLQKRREAIENSRINGFGQNVTAFDKALGALGQANGQSVDMADKMFGQTSTRRGQDIVAQKNLWDAQSSDKTATAQLLTALGVLGGGDGKAGGSGGSGGKGATSLVDLVKKAGETLYPDDKFDIRKRAGLANILTNAEDVQALQTLIENGGEAAGLEYLAANQGDNVRSNSLAALGVGQARKGGPIDGAWAHVKDIFGGAPHKLGNGMYEVDGEMIDEMDYRKRIGKATSNLIRDAVNSPGASPGKDASGADIMSFNEFQEAGGDLNGYNSYLKSVSAGYLKDRAAFPKEQ